MSFRPSAEPQLRPVPGSLTSLTVARTIRIPSSLRVRTAPSRTHNGRVHVSVTELGDGSVDGSNTAAPKPNRPMNTSTTTAMP